MTDVSDRYLQWDAAYVLGALSPAERREFEEHLARCPACQAAVSELAGMPGLLAQVQPDDAAGLLGLLDAEFDSSAEPPFGGAEELAPPRSLMPRLITQRARRRRLALAVAAIAAALALIAGGIGVGLGVLPFQRGPQRLAFDSVVPSAITAVVDLVPVTGGTDVRVECQYGEVNEPSHGGYSEYTVVVVDRFGHAMEVKRWSAKPNKVMRPSGTTPLRIGQIADVEIRDAADQTLLRAYPR